MSYVMRVHEFIDYLIADFLTFEAGDIVVYEHFDNAGDSNGHEVSVYIYAKIIRKVLNGTARFPIYLVNIGDGKEIEVRSYRLYKIVRPSHATPTELELYTDGNTENRDTKLAEILQMIEETLFSLLLEEVALCLHSSQSLLLCPLYRFILETSINPD
jgi:hypothetical protein